MTHWTDLAREAIQAVHNRLPDNATLADRKAALRAAYPFGARKNWPYKAWTQEVRHYLSRWEPAAPPRSRPAIRRAKPDRDDIVFPFGEKS
jgi:hypothetical protein